MHWMGRATNMEKGLASIITSSALVLSIFALLIFESKDAIHRNSLAYHIAQTELLRILEWYKPSVQQSESRTWKCSYLAIVNQYPQLFACNGTTKPDLERLWQARVYWLTNQTTSACNIWRELNAPVDPWVIALAAREEANWTQVASALQCLDEWYLAKLSTKQLIATIYKGDIAVVYRDLGDQIAKEGNTASALLAYNQALKWLPEDGKGLAPRIANSLLQLEGPDPAIRYLQGALDENDVTNREYRYTLLILLGEAQQKGGYLQNALDTIEEARNILPDKLEPYVKVMRIYTEMEKPDKAIEALQLGLVSPAADPTRVRNRRVLFTLLGHLYRSESKWNEAYCAYQNAIQEPATNAADENEYLARSLSQLDLELKGTIQCSAQ